MIEMMLGGFGDKRLAAVGVTLLGALQTQRTLCVHRLAKVRNQALRFGRLLANPKVTVQEMLARTAQQIGQRLGGHESSLSDSGS